MRSWRPAMPSISGPRSTAASVNVSGRKSEPQATPKPPEPRTLSDAARELPADVQRLIALRRYPLDMSTMYGKYTTDETRGDDGDLTISVKSTSDDFSVSGAVHIHGDIAGFRLVFDGHHEWWKPTLCSLVCLKDKVSVKFFAWKTSRSVPGTLCHLVYVVYLLWTKCSRSPRARALMADAMPKLAGGDVAVTTSRMPPPDEAVPEERRSSDRERRAAGLESKVRGYLQRCAAVHVEHMAPVSQGGRGRAGTSAKART